MKSKFSKNINENSQYTVIMEIIWRFEILLQRRKASAAHEKFPFQFNEIKYKETFMMILTHL